MTIQAISDLKKTHSLMTTLLNELEVLEDSIKDALEDGTYRVKASMDGDGNIIKDTYATKEESFINDNIIE